MKNNIAIIVGFAAFAVMSAVVVGEYRTTVKAMEQGLQQCKVWNDTDTSYEILWRKDCPANE